MWLNNIVHFSKNVFGIIDYGVSMCTALSMWNCKNSFNVLFHHDCFILHKSFICIMGDLSFEILSSSAIQLPSLISHWQFVPRESIFINLRKMRSGKPFHSYVILLKPSVTYLWVCLTLFSFLRHCGWFSKRNFIWHIFQKYIVICILFMIIY